MPQQETCSEEISRQSSQHTHEQSSQSQSCSERRRTRQLWGQTVHQQYKKSCREICKVCLELPFLKEAGLSCFFKFIEKDEASVANETYIRSGLKTRTESCQEAPPHHPSLQPSHHCVSTVSSHLGSSPVGLPGLCFLPCNIPPADTEALLTFLGHRMWGANMRARLWADILFLSCFLAVW